MLVLLSILVLFVSIRHFVTYFSAFILCPALPCLVDGMSEVTSLHEMSEPRSHGHSRPPQLPTLYDDPDDRMSTISSVSQHQRPRRHNDSPMNHGARGRARSMDNLDVIYQHSNDDDYPQNYKSGARGGRRG